MLVSEEEHFGEGWVEGEVGHGFAKLGQLSRVVERAEYLELVETGHDVVLRRWVHKVEVQQILHSQILEHQHDVG